MTGISVAVANRIFNKFGISFKRHDVAGFLACRGGQQIHTSTLVEACQKVLEQWFVLKELDSNGQIDTRNKKPLKYAPGDEE
ncbi:hypothetical protein F7734_10055 [Scytonema sp. UIC 10036]|uniref:hypothetical protein n=1 Tax=Scytonema sp. UIC 10036 TaxID=2304196 RepID=UPI0012DA0F15|nr:hypothetical protein [Scytonema sp. UIC 10036]MUG92774.1 hypothetical protein [Scytonema sp. UIC 10036]